MVAAISLVIIVSLTIAINRIATNALTHTGLSEETAKFQSRSAFTGSGFTTTETENVMDHPVRRRIIFTLMLIGNVGMVTAMSSLVLAFAGPAQQQSHHYYISIGIIVAGLALLLWFTRSNLADRVISRWIDRAIEKYTDIDVRDYAALLHLAGDYQITDLHIEPGDWIANKTLQESQLSAEGVVVLGIQRKDKDFIGSPGGDIKLLPNDLLTVYGKGSSFKELDERRAGRRGDVEHEEAVLEHEKNIEEEHEEFEGNQDKKEAE